MLTIINVSYQDVEFFRDNGQRFVTKLVIYIYIYIYIYKVSGSLVQTAQTWANAGVCSDYCAPAFGCLFVCLFVIACLFVCFKAILVIGCCEGEVHYCYFLFQ